MRKTIGLFILTLLAGISSARAYELHDEDLAYKVMYKWGLIKKQAGTVTIETRAAADGFYSSKLIGVSASWADRFFSVRDTLTGTLDSNSLAPVYYEKIAREGGGYKRDVIEYTREGDSVVGRCTRWKLDKKAKKIVETRTDQVSSGFTVDILGAFYYMRHLDYATMQPGESVSCTIFSGQKKETLRITFQGLAPVTIDGSVTDTYYITFTFTGNNGKKSSDDMNAWISTDPQRIPLVMVGNLPVGSIRCYYIGK